MSRPIICEHCGTVFASSFDMGPGFSHGMMYGNIQDCPNCHKITRDIEGVFSMQGNTVLVHSATPETYAMIDRLKSLAQRAKTEGMSNAEIIAQVAGISPELADEIRRRGLGGAFLILVLVFLAMVMHSCVDHTVGMALDAAVEAAQNHPADAPLPSLSPALPPTTVPNQPSYRADPPLPETVTAIVPPLALNRRRRREEAAKARANAKKRPPKQSI